MNRDSHIASSPISQSSFFEELRYLILASSKRKLRGCIDFLKFDVRVKKIKKIHIRLRLKSPPIFIKISIKHHSVLVHLRTKFQLDKSKFAWVRQFWKNSQKIQNLKKFERINRFWPNLIPKFLCGCNIFVCSFRTITRILRKLELPHPFFKKFKIPWNHKSCINCHENSHDQRVVIASLVYQISHRYLKPFMSYRGFKRWKWDTHAHTHTCAHTHIHPDAS